MSRRLLRLNQSAYKFLFICAILAMFVDLLHTEVKAADSGPSVKYKLNNTIYDETHGFPTLVNARSITIDPEYDNGGQSCVLYWDNTVKCGDSRYSSDATHAFPSLAGAKSIAIYGGQGYVHYSDNTVKVKQGNQISDVSYLFPNLENAKSIAIDLSRTYVLYPDNTVKSKDSSNQITDMTYALPNLESARSIAVNQAGRLYAAYLDQPPILTVSSSNQVAYTSGSGNTLTLSGTVLDQDNDNVTISATVGGVTKTTTVPNTATAQNWALQWNVASDYLAAGTYSNITVTANDGLWGTTSATYTGNMVVDILPNAPTALQPGGTSAAPTLVGSLTPTLSWVFTDPDAGDVQSAYNVQIFNASGTTLIRDTGWLTSSSSTFTVPSGILSRGTVYGWRVAVKDRHGGASTYSSMYYFKTNTLPNLSITSYVDGQQMDDNVLSMIWTYNDADGQGQTQYRIQGSRNNWTTIEYDSGVMNGSARSMTLPALSEGTWNFRVTGSDGMEWSVAATRNNLKIPNANDIKPPTARGAFDSMSSELSGVFNGTGWALDMNGVNKIEIMVDGVVKATAVYGNVREDIYNMYPNYNNHNSGFHYSLDTRLLTNGQHTLSILETSNTNVQTLLANKTITVNNVRAATILSENIPVAMQAGQEYPVTITVRNDGDFPWSEALAVRLGGVGDSDPFTSARKALAGGQTVAPGQTYTFTFTMKAPGTAGTYTTDWQMVQDGVQWFGQVLTKPVVVSRGFEYFYDTHGRLDYIQTSSGQVIDYEYDSNGNLMNILYP